MAHARTLPDVEPWPPDDTEESILGTDLHQTTILNLRWGINEAAHIYRLADEDVPWKALDQIELIGCRRPDGSFLRTYPDVFVYPHPIDPLRGSFSIDADGAPVLVIEVLSESTWKSDLDIARGKGFSYTHAGVQEYMALDPTGALLPERVRAWRLREGRVVPWEPDQQGRWQSETITVTIGFEGLMATVYTHDGERMPREGEMAATIARQAREAADTIARQAAEIDELRRRLRDIERGG